MDQESYLDTIDCVSDLYAYMNKQDQIYRHPYWVFDFVLYEISFDWFFQCFVMAKQPIDTSKTARTAQDCQAYRLASSYSIDSYTPRSVRGDDAITMLRLVRGGYTREMVSAYETYYKSAAETSLRNIKTNIVNSVYQRQDTSYPRCSSNLKWKLGQEYANEYNAKLRSLIQTFYYSEACEYSWMKDQIEELQVNGINVTYDNWWQRLTTADVNAFFTDPNWKGSKTLLETLIDYAMQSMSVLLTERVMGINPSPAGLKFVTRREAFVMNNEMPLQFTNDLLYDLDPSFTMLDPSDIVQEDDPTVHHTCLYGNNNKDDPAISTRSGCSTQRIKRELSEVTDELTVCAGSVFCTHVPIYYAMNGILNCQYYPTLPGYHCDGLTQGCGQALLNALYLQIYNAYSPAPVTPLKPVQFPWFAGNATWGFKFDLTGVMDFLGNIMPNKEQTVMCTIKTELVNLTNCTNPHYLRLKKHVQEHFMYNGSVIVPNDAQMDWKVDREFLSSGAIFSFASVDRNISYTFLNALFDDDTVCKGDITGDKRVCWKESASTKFNSLNPWVLGYWNPYVKCDVDYSSNTQVPVEYVNAGCSEAVCKEDGPYYTNMPLKSTCKNLFGEQVTTPGVPRIDVFGDYLPYNLCHHKLVEDQVGCLHDQGLLGGYDGLPVASGDDSEAMNAQTQYSGSKYEVSSNMYTPSTWEIPDDFMGGLFDGTNPLWAGEDAIYGFLRVPPHELGIHRIGLQITRVDNSSTLSQIDVYKLPLGTDGDRLDLDAPDMASRPVAEWVPTLQAQILADSAANQKTDGYYNSLVRNSTAASCPLRRFAFYSSTRPSFAPSMPSPQRAKHLFGNITGRAYAHPTMRQVTTGEFLGRYTTPNGFCFCPYVEGLPQPHCRIRIGAAAETCSLTHTVLAVLGRVEGTSHVFRPRTSLQQDMTCRMLLDWPRLPIELRDGSPGPSADANFRLASDLVNRKCHVLDRFRPFQYKYASVPEFPSPGADSWARGVCQTRRVASVTAAKRAELPGGRCVRDALEPGQSMVRCARATGRVAVPRPTQRSPRATVAKARDTRRVRCDRCAPPPRFETSGRARMDPPESSFGRPFRLSAERMMAKDLRDAVCGGDEACPVLNRSAWRPGEFMRNFLLAPARLFVNATAPAPARRAAAPLDDSANWTDHGWVYCPDRKSLVSGKGCVGSISREQWMRSKTTVCPRMVRSLSSNGSHGGMATVPFFSIDNYTQAVNVAYEEARQLVGLANCIAAGNFSCLPRPWAYHPASYVPSNLQWAHKTVLDYYRLVKPGTCPPSEQEKRLIAVNQKFMQDCPANTLRFFQDILAIVRLVGTELTYIVSTLISMGFKLVTLLFAGAESGLKSSVRVAQQELAADWAWVKNQAKSMLAGVNRLLVDMLFSTGQVGKVLLNFMTSACERINRLYAWLMGVWCKFLQKHLPYFLTVLRKGLSMIASGFEILQDFMDVVFEGVLPAAFIAKYGNNLFQKSLFEKYSQPTNRKSGYLTRVQSSARMNNVAMNKLKKLGLTTGVGKTLGRASMLISAGLMAWETYDTINGMVNYPKNFTLFDFSGVFDGIDNMMDHVGDDEMCLEFTTAQRYNMSVSMLSCFRNSLLVDPALANRAATAIAPTLCWANAQTSLGQSNLFSCHSGSTCCPDNECATPIVCNECPTPKFTGEVQYGCNTLRQQCQCSVALEAYTPCTSNQQCAGTSQCVLASLTSGVSYGTIPCASCVTQNMFCTVTPAGLPGQCTCYTDASVPQALCTDASGTNTRVDGTRLCGYAADATASDSVWQFALEQLAMVQCARAPAKICSTVWVTESNSVRLAVAIPPLRASGRRRLLWDDAAGGQDAYDFEGDFETFDEAEAREVLAAPGWEDTAAPCAELVRRHHKAEALGTLERHELHRCAYWRFAGRRTIELLNLTRLAKHETFLLSAEDLARAMTDGGAVLEVLSTPWVFVYAALYHPWARPLRAVATVAANTIEQTEWLRRWLLDEEEEAEELLDFVTGADDGDPEAALEEVVNFTRWRAEGRARRLINPRPPPAQDQPPPRPTTHPRRKGRALLSVISDIQLVKEFSAKIVQTGDPTVPLPQQVAQAWGQGPFVWPPQFNYHAGGCAIGTVVLALSTEAVSVLVLYYANFDKPLPPIDRSLRGTLPQISWNHTRKAVATAANTARRPATWASTVFHYVTGQIMGLSASDISNFFVGSSRWSLLWTVQSLVQCDLGAAVSCSRHKRDLIMSIVLFVLLYLVVQMFAGATGFTFLTSVLFYGSPFILLWYVYGVAPTCFPVLPTCLLADLLTAAEYVLPASIDFPQELLCANETLGNATCLTACSELGFGSWEDTLAFALCDTDARWCEALGHAGKNTSEYQSTFAPLFAPLQSALLDKSRWFLVGNGTAPSRLAAYRVCSWVTWVSVLPYLLLLASLVFATGSILLGIVQLGPSFFSLLAQTWAFHRAPAGAD